PSAAPIRIRALPHAQPAPPSSPQFRSIHPSTRYRPPPLLRAIPPRETTSPLSQRKSRSNSPHSGTGLPPTRPPIRRAPQPRHPSRLPSSLQARSTLTLPNLAVSPSVITS